MVRIADSTGIELGDEKMVEASARLRSELDIERFRSEDEQFFLGFRGWRIHPESSIDWVNEAGKHSGSLPGDSTELIRDMPYTIFPDF